MYRYSVDQTIIYTSEDFVLFRESPFACWMERLTLENPDHGIPSDVGSCSPGDTLESQDDLAMTLEDEGRDVVLIEWGADEAARRTATLAAMRHGSDFIVNGQLAVGPLSGSVNLLMRTSGYSELGSYLYIPCDTQQKTTLNSAFRLCFLADLLHSLQGQLPPQMLILRPGSDVMPLQTEDHIYHYSAVKQRFMTAQRSFRKHRMPDPVEASHFGRWSECANEVLKQRALGQTEIRDLLEEDERNDKPVISAPVQGSVYDLDEAVGSDHSHIDQRGVGTLAEQAQVLGSGTESQHSAHVDSEEHLQQLEFIGSSATPPLIGRAAKTEVPPPVATQFKEPPPANLRNPAVVDMDAAPGAGFNDRRTPPFSSSLITNRESNSS